MEIYFIENGKSIHWIDEVGFIPKKNDFVEIHGKEWQVDYVKWVIHEEDGFYVEIYLKPLSMEK